MNNDENKSTIPFNIFASKCPSRTTLDRLFSRWTVLILALLSEKPSRFSELARNIEGISERMLSKSLKLLEEENFVYRKDFLENPPRVEYGLTPSGEKISKGVLNVIEQMYVELENRN